MSSNVHCTKYISITSLYTVMHLILTTYWIIKYEFLDEDKYSVMSSKVGIIFRKCRLLVTVKVLKLLIFIVGTEFALLSLF